MRLLAAAGFLALNAYIHVSAQTIQFDASRQVWLITTAHSSYAMGLTPDGELQHLYWAGPLARIQDVPRAARKRDISSFDPHQMLENEEYPGWGGPRFFEPALKITRANGDRDLVLRYRDQHLASDQLDIRLRDIRDPIDVVLHYRVFPQTGIIARWSTIENHTNQIITLESAQSAAWNLPHGTGFHLTYLTGRWAAEDQVRREPVQEGMRVLESRLGHTGHNFSPWFAIDQGDAGEETGRVWFGSLAWSGNWRITVEQTPYQQVRITGGLNTFDFSYPLQPGESLETPHFYAGFAEHGWGEASRLLHRLELADIEPLGLHARPRPVLYNSWEATEFNVSEEGQKQLAAKAAKLGVELFVVDDGWFGRRNNDHAGLGDWYVNPQKFPHGLAPLISYVNGLGMDFGLWVEPEMVNPDSDLYRAHPDWVMNFPGRPRSELRNQLVLNLARPDVKEFIFNTLDRLATQYHIRYFKWDMNRIFSEPGWPDVAPSDQRKLWVQYVTNLYDIMHRLREKHPDLEIESCSGGGGRVDLGVLRYVDEFWTSDNTEAFDRLHIQNGFTQAFAPKLMSAWVTDVPNMNGRSTSLDYRFLVAMQGALGIGANLNKWTDEDSRVASNWIALYKRIRNTIQFGDLYRLRSPWNHDVSAVEYLSAEGNQAVVFAYRHSQEFNTPAPSLRLAGLDPRAIYHLDSPDGKLLSARELSGSWLQQNGIDLRLRNDYDASVVILHRSGDHP
jgi:alpha-galactosidase